MGLIAIATFGFQSFAEAASTLADYWAGNAHWTFIKKWTVGNSGQTTNGGSFIRIVGDGTWYLFSRTIPATPSGCSIAIGTQVWKSIDQGTTWTNPTAVIVPTANKPWACAATDGDAYYDAGQNKWRYLFQCLGTDGYWRGCYAERAGADPMGPFTPSPFNPVINAGALWNQICNATRKDCVTLAGGIDQVHDEGTFNIFTYDGTYFWVSFHGFDGKNGYRGIAKTTDFVNWVVGNPSLGVPNDAIFDAYDAASWREHWVGGAVGGGAGSILLDGGYYYQIVESAETNLGCLPGQNWDDGIFRSASLTATSWEQYPLGNPIVYSSKLPEPYKGQMVSLPCNVQYPQLLRDPQSGITYLKYERVTDDPNYLGIYLYELTHSDNVLKNGDLWMGDASYWAAYPIGPTNLAVYRYPNSSSDGGQYLATNCGTNPNPCQSGQSIYQDVDVSAHPGYWYTFGGKFSAESGSGSLSLDVFQLDQNYAILQSNTLNVAVAAGSYQSIDSQPYVILNSTKYLRYQFYLSNANVTYFADEMYVNVTPSVPDCSMGTSWSMSNSSIGHIIGRPDADGWSANTTQDPTGFLQYGPYTSQLAAGNHVAKWKLMIDNNIADNLSIVQLQVEDFANGATVLVSRDVTRTQWSTPYQYECFALPFTLGNSPFGHKLEFRVLWDAHAYVREQTVGVD